VIVTHSFRIVAAITGASGSIYGLRILEKLARRPEVETHLILSRGGERTLYLETGKTAAELRPLAHHWHSPEDIGASIASGSYPIHAMVVAPCSVHTMSAICAGISSNLVVRAADVTLKERRKLILMVRETPFHLGHLRTMASLTEMGAIICPPIPGFYHHPQTVLDLVDHSVDRVLDLIGLPEPGASRWDPKRGSGSTKEPDEAKNP
jgi:4-hydroxy-3-polyprenylbenzoate decarboxylase